MVALLAVACCTYKFFTVRKRNKALRLGEDGEKAVGQYLEDLRTAGVACSMTSWATASTSTTSGFPARDFVIETKTYSKWGRGVVEFNGERILVNGTVPERNSVHQVRALGAWLRDLLMESTGRRFPIRCAVVFPGWFVEDHAKKPSDVWVINPKGLHLHRTRARPVEARRRRPRVVAHNRPHAEHRVERPVPGTDEGISSRFR